MVIVGPRRLTGVLPEMSGLSGTTDKPGTNSVLVRRGSLPPRASREFASAAGFLLPFKNVVTDAPGFLRREKQATCPKPNDLSVSLPVRRHYSSLRMSGRKRSGLPFSIPPATVMRNCALR